MAESLTKKTFNGFFWTLGGKMTSAVMQIVVLAVLARLISPSSFGLIQAALIVVGFAQLISKMGIGPALVQRDTLTEVHIRTGFTFSLVLGVFLGGLIILLSDPIADFFEFNGLSRVLKVISLLFISEAFITVSSSLIQRELRFKERSIIEMLSYVIGYGGMGILFGYLGYDYWALIIAIFSQEIIKVIAYAIIQRHSMIPLWSFKELKELLYYGGGMTLGRFGNYFGSQGDNIVTGRMLGSVYLGIYSQAYKIMVKPSNLFGDAIDKVLFPIMSKIQNDKKKLGRVFIGGSQLINFLCIPLTVVFFFDADDIVRVLLGKQWLEAIIPLKILAIGLLFRMGYKIGTMMAKATGRVYGMAKIQFIYGICIILGSYIGSFWGINGVAFGALFAILVNYILLINLSIKIAQLNWSYFIKHVFRSLGGVLLVSLIFIPINIFFKETISNSYLSLFVSITTFFIIFILYMYMYGHHLKFLQLLPFKNKMEKYMRGHF